MTFEQICVHKSKKLDSTMGEAIKRYYKDKKIIYQKFLIQCGRLKPRLISGKQSNTRANISMEPLHARTLCDGDDCLKLKSSP